MTDHGLEGGPTMQTPPIVAAEEWEAARQRLLVKEKEVSRAKDALAAERRRMPWLAVDKEYAFDAPQGTASLLDLFEGRRQLIVYRAFFEPGVYGWPGHGDGPGGSAADHAPGDRQAPGPAGRGRPGAGRAGGAAPGAVPAALGADASGAAVPGRSGAVSYTHLRAHET